MLMLRASPFLTHSTARTHCLLAAISRADDDAGRRLVVVLSMISLHACHHGDLPLPLLLICTFDLLLAPSWRAASSADALDDATRCIPLLGTDRVSFLFVSRGPPAMATPSAWPLVGCTVAPRRTT